MGGRGASSGRRPYYLTGIGLDSRITEEGESTGTSPSFQAQERVTEEQAREAQEWADRMNEAKMAELRERDAAMERESAARAEAKRLDDHHAQVQREMNSYRTASDRQVVSYAKPKVTQEQLNAQFQAARQREIDSANRARARNEARRQELVSEGKITDYNAAPVPTARVVPASQPGFFSRIGSKLFGKK